MKRNIFFVSILLHFCAGQAQNTAFPSLEDLDAKPHRKKNAIS